MYLSYQVEIVLPNSEIKHTIKTYRLDEVHKFLQKYDVKGSVISMTVFVGSEGVYTLLNKLTPPLVDPRTEKGSLD